MSESIASNRTIIIFIVMVVFVVGLGVGFALRLAAKPPADDSMLGAAREGWLNMYGTMSGGPAGSQIEYFVYHPSVERDVVREYAESEAKIIDIKDTVYETATIIHVARENRDVLSTIESQPWVRFAMRGELLFFCH